MKKLLIILMALSVIFSSCHDDGEESKGITGINFKEGTKNIYVGETATVEMEIKGDKSKAEIKYGLSREGIVEIKSGSGNEGVIIEGKARGTVVLTAENGNHSSYCNIVVGGSDEKLIPHIISPASVIEAPVNSRRTVTVTLAGGTPADNSNFIWTASNSGIFGSIEYAGAVCVFETSQSGESKITVRHPKAQYGIDILVFVTEKGEAPVYITSEKTVLDIKKENGEYQFKVKLVGSDKEEKYGFIYDVVEGKEVIQLQSGYTDIATIIPKKAGIAVIRVSHQKAAYTYEVQAVVTEELNYRYMETSESFLIMGLDREEVINVRMKGDALPEDYAEKYEYSVSEEGIIYVYRTKEIFYIRSLSKGKTVLKIENEYADFAREILVIVGDETERVSDNEKYITTSQNVITMEVGGNDEILNMLLVGGNEADRNGFTWYVEDSGIIDVEQGENGRVVRNELPEGRTVIRGVNYEELKAGVLISAKKAGTGKIVVRHPKAKNEGVVIVKVYPRNTYGETPGVLEGSPYYKLPIGYESWVKLQEQSGEKARVGKVEWKTADSQVAEITDAAGLESLILAKKRGITELEVSGGNLRNEFRALLITADMDEINECEFIYVMNPFINLTEGQSVIVPVLSEHVSAEKMESLECENGNREVASVMFKKGVLGITAEKTGTGEVIIRGVDINEIKITINVEREKINVETPFYLTGERGIIGMVKGKEKIIEVNLVGGTEKSEEGITWSSENESVIKVTGNGKRARLEAKKEGQTVIKAGHGRSQNVLSMAVYAVNSEEELNNRVVIAVEKNNYLIKMGEKILINVKTNANDMEKAGINWAVDNVEIADIETGGDKTSGIIRGIKTGTARLTVSHAKNLTSQIIYISVSDGERGTAYLGVTPIIEAVVGSNINISAVSENMGGIEESKIKWEIDDEKTALIAGNGLNCYVQLLKKGRAEITVRQEELGIVRKILLYVYETYKEMSESYVMGAQNGYYRLNEGDVVEAELVFGLKGFPENETSNIIWETENNNVVRIAGNGKKCRIEAANGGITYVKAKSGAAMNKEAVIEIEVMEKKERNDGYWISVRREDEISGIVKGGYKDITVSLYKDDVEINNGMDLFKFEESDNRIIGIAQVGNFIRVTAKETGTAHITASYGGAESKRIFVHVGENENKIREGYPIFFEKNNHLIKKGEERNIEIKTVDDDQEKISRITVNLEKNNGSAAVTKTGKNLKIIGVKKGNEVIVVNYDGNEAGKLYVSVSESQEAEITTYMETEKIIAVKRGTEYETRVNTGLSEWERELIKWTVDDEGKAVLIKDRGRDAVILALEEGRTYIRARIGNIERKALVCVYGTENEKNGIRAINVEQGYYIINEGQELNINICAYGGKYEGNTVYEDNYGYEEKYAGIIDELEKTAERMTVKGKKEGVAAIRIRNELCEYDDVVYVEVRKGAKGTSGGGAREFYMTAEKTLYILEEGEGGILVNTKVLGGDFYQFAYFKWEGYDPEIIGLEAGGGYAHIKALKRGETKIQIRNVYCENGLEITVIVGERYATEVVGEPYIYANGVIREYRMGEQDDVVLYEIRNEERDKRENYKFTVIGDSVRLDTGSYGKITVRTACTGITQARLESGDGKTYLDFYFIVRESETGGAVYLTTEENYVITELNETKNVDIRLEGYFEIDSTKYEWEIDDKKVAKVVGNGTRGQIHPLMEGEAVITVRHNRADYPLRINLKVSKNAGERAVYLTTTTNVVEAVRSETLNYIYVQKMGGNIEKRGCVWNVDNPGIISVMGNGYEGIFTAKKAGIAKVSVRSEEGGYTLEIVVIVREPSGSNLYIKTERSLIMMSPGNEVRRVTVDLEGGDETDKKNFKWEIYGQFPADAEVSKASGNVVSIVGSGDQCNISSINDGVAKLRVTHGKADNPLYITVYVTRYNEVNFPMTAKEMRAGSSEFMELKVPTYENFKEKIYCVSDNPEVATVIFTNNSVLITAHEEGVAIIKARIGGQEEEAQMYVDVKKDFDHEKTRIVTPRTSYSFHPRSNVEKLTAYLVGGYSDSENGDDITWELNEKDNPVISVFPSTGKGSQIEITPRREGLCLLTVKHKNVEEKYWKVINIEVTESENALVLDKSSMVLRGGMAQALKAEIMGGRVKDYNEIVWIADMMGTKEGLEREVVMIMGQGKQVMLYPRNYEGTVYVWAYFGGFKEKCIVTVQLEELFNIELTDIRLNPGEEKEINYNIRPETQFIQWVNTGEDVVGYEVSQAAKKIKIWGTKEGAAVIRGIAGKNTGGINVRVAWNYQLTADISKKFEPSEEGHKNGKNVINFQVKPEYSMVRIEKPADMPEIEYKIEMDGKGNGKIIMTSDVEFKNKVLKLVQYMPGDGKETGKSIEVTVHCFYDDNEPPVPYFVRYSGNWTNTEIKNDLPDKNEGYKALGEEINNIGGNVYTINVGDGEDHYILFDKKYGNSMLEIEGITAQGAAPPQGLKFEKVEIVRNNIKQAAIRISGGDDEMEYDRVKFSHDLTYDIRMNGDDGNITNINVSSGEIKGNYRIEQNDNDKKNNSFRYEGVDFYNSEIDFNKAYYAVKNNAGYSGYDIYKYLYELDWVEDNGKDREVVYPLTKYIQSQNGLDLDGRYGITKYKDVHQIISRNTNGNKAYYKIEPIIRILNPKVNNYVYWNDIHNYRTGVPDSDYHYFYHFYIINRQEKTNDILGMYNKLEESMFDVYFANSLGAGRIAREFPHLLTRFGTGWSSRFYIHGIVDKVYFFKFDSSFNGGVDGIAYNIDVESEIFGEQRLKWEENEESKTIPLVNVNTFPFKLENGLCFSIKEPSSKVTSVPMPTTSVQKINNNSDTYYDLRYKTVDGIETIKFKVTYEKRNCHHLYDGVNEVEGETNWGKLEKVNENLYKLISSTNEP